MKNKKKAAVPGRASNGQINHISKIDSIKEEEISNKNFSGDNAKSDAFDPEKLRLSQDFGAEVGAKKIITMIPVRRPHRQEFVRVHTDENYRLQAAIIELKTEGEFYIVENSLQNELAAEISRKMLFTAINRQGVLFLWPINLPKEDGRHDKWSRTAWEAAIHAQSKWTRVSSNMDRGAYDIIEAPGNFSEPEWPDLSFGQILKISFKDKKIDSIDHLAIRKLRGEI